MGVGGDVGVVRSLGGWMCNHAASLQTSVKSMCVSLLACLAVACFATELHRGLSSLRAHLFSGDTRGAQKDQVCVAQHDARAQCAECWHEQHEQLVRKGVLMRVVVGLCGWKGLGAEADSVVVCLFALTCFRLGARTAVVNPQLHFYQTPQLAHNSLPEHLWTSS